MSEVFIPIGGAGGKNRGDILILHNKEDIRKLNNFDAILGKLPPGLYKKKTDNKLVVPELDNREVELPGLGDGQNATIMYSKEYIKALALKAFEIASITNFRATMYAHKQVRLTWAKPTRGLWSGTRFIFKYDSTPTSVTDGFTYWDSADVHYETPALQERQLYVRAFNYVTTNSGRWYDDGKLSATIQVTGISGAVSFGAGAGTWTVPANVYKIRYIVVGHGGRGGNGDGQDTGGGGGGGGTFATGYMDVTPGQSIPWIVPTTNSSVNDYYVPLNSGTYNGVDRTSSFTKFGTVWVDTGRDGDSSTWLNRSNPQGYGGAGGSGGGAGNYEGGAGGTNGGNGGGSKGGAGQGTPTTGFNGVLYCGGGAGVGGIRQIVQGGAGGGGNAGASHEYNTRGMPGTDGLGGGGGGGRGRSTTGWNSEGFGGQGGTGCIYIAWGSSMNDGS